MYNVVLRRTPGSGFRQGSKWYRYASKEFFDQRVRGDLEKNYLEIVEEGVTEVRALELVKKDPSPDPIESTNDIAVEEEMIRRRSDF